MCLFGLHVICNQNAQLGSLGHHALKCAIDGPRIETHPPLSHEYDKECGWCIHCLKCIAMLCFALCCCQKQILQEALAGRPSPVPTDHPSMADSLNKWPVIIPFGRWPIPLAGGVPQHSEKQPWELYSFQRRITVKAEATCAWQWLSKRSRVRIALGPLPVAVYCFH